MKLDIVQFSYRKNAKKDWRLPLFYEFLQLSSGYRKAHLATSGQKRKTKRRLDPAAPHGFNVILNTYAAFGDVWNHSVDEWWFQHARMQLEPLFEPEPAILHRMKGLTPRSAYEIDIEYVREQNELITNAQEYLLDKYLEQLSSNFLFVAIPLNGPKRKIWRKTKAMIDEHATGAAADEFVASFQFDRKSRLQKSTVEQYVAAVKLRALNPHWTDVDLGLELAKQFGGKYSDPDDPDFDERNLSIMTNEKLKFARNVASRASLGQFPNRQPHGKDVNTPEFDYDFIAREIKNGSISRP